LSDNLSDVTAAILAGGLGTRLRSVVADRPKVLAEVRGRPFLTYLFDQIAAAGIRHVVVCTGYRGEQVEATLGDTYGSLRLEYSRELEPLGTAGALRLALPRFDSDSVLVMNGDSICRANLEAFWAWHRAQGGQATLLLVQVSDTQRFGQVRVDEAGRVLAFDEKGRQTGAGWINAGVYLFNRDLLRSIPARRAVSLEHQMFPAWIGRGLYGYRSRGGFLDIGIPEAYATAGQFLDLSVNGLGNET